MDQINRIKYCLPQRNISFEEKMIQEDIEPMLAVLVKNRGVEDVDAIKSILTGEKAVFHDPFLFRDMEKAVEIISEAVFEQKRIIVYGDYDVDGIAATSIMMSVLRELDALVEFIIPDRFDEGYGLNMDFVESAYLTSGSLLITVDCGIASVNEVNAAKRKGVQVIITDHHLPGEILPDADAIINPQVKDCGYPEKTLCGAGVAWKIAHALLDECPYEYVDLAAVATIADIVPLQGENRHIVSEGLKRIRSGSRLALNKLLEASSVSYKDVDVQKIAFSVAPRINSLGRMGDAAPAVDMLLSQNESLVIELVEKCVSENKIRQQIEKDILQQALQQIDESQWHMAGALVVAGEGWHQGVLGIVASRLVEAYHVPAVVLTIVEGKAKGSARSIAGYNIRRAFDDCAQPLSRYGGHAMAAGLELETSSIDEFREIFAAHARDHMLDHGVEPILLDAALGLECVSSEFVEALKKLEPTGAGFASPLFYFPGLQVADTRKIGAGKEHMILNFKDDKRMVSGISFRYQGPELADGQTVDVIGIPEINEYNGYSSSRIFVKQILELPGAAAKSFSLAVGSLLDDRLHDFSLGCDFDLTCKDSCLQLNFPAAKIGICLKQDADPVLKERIALAQGCMRLRLCWVDSTAKKLFFIENPTETVYRAGRGFVQPLIDSCTDKDVIVKSINSTVRNSVIVCNSKNEVLSYSAQLVQNQDETPVVFLTEEEKSRNMPAFLALIASGKDYILAVTLDFFEKNLLNAAWLTSGLQILPVLDKVCVDSLEEKIYYNTVPLMDRRVSSGS